MPMSKVAAKWYYRYVAHHSLDKYTSGMILDKAVELAVSRMHDFVLAVDVRDAAHIVAPPASV